MNSYPKNRRKRGTGPQYAQGQELIKREWAEFQKRCEDPSFRLAALSVLIGRLNTLKNKPVVSREDLLARLRARSRSYRERNLEKVRAQMREHSKERVKDGRAKEYMRKYITRPEARLKARIRCRVYDALKRQSVSKNTGSWIGCTGEVLFKHIESQFLPGMTWDNMGRGDGKWSTDHIRPLAAFDLSDPKQQAEAFHYTNLKPMWAKENCSKSSNYNGRKWFHADHRMEVAA